MTRAIGTVENGYVLTPHLGWVQLNFQAPHDGPWRPGDVVGGHTFTGERWSPLPAGWLPDPSRRHHLRWWTGHFWSEHAMTNGQAIHDPLAPHPADPQSRPAAPQAARPPTALQTVGLLSSWIGRVGTVIYCGTWFLVAVYSLSIVISEKDPRWLALTATASGNTFAYKLNMTYGQLKRQLRKEIKAKILYIAAGAVLAGGVWLSLYFNDSSVLTATAALVLIVLMFAWVFN